MRTAGSAMYATRLSPSTVEAISQTNNSERFNIKSKPNQGMQKHNLQANNHTMAHWGEQFSSGDQSYGSRYAFWSNGFRSCPKCKSSDITAKTEVAGCRRNGDGYGTEVFTCNSCKWSTSFQYDEASDTYYYETRFWDRPVRETIAIQDQGDDAKKTSELK